MHGQWKDSAHLIRPAVAFLIALGLFAILRSAVVPATFGQLGHYRAAALTDIRKRPVRFAGQATCATCHSDQAGVRAKGKHRSVSCEACHGALAAHADDPVAVKPVLPDTTKLCRGCHEADTAKPAWFKQVASAEHSGGEPCKSCHQPHNPGM